MTLLLAVLVIGLQVVTGTVWWAWLRRGSTMTWTEALGMGTAIGALLALASAQLLRTTPAASWAWAIPSVLAIVVLALAAARRISLARIEERARDAWWDWGPAAVIGLAILIPTIARTPITDGYVSGARYSGDLVFQESVSRTVTVWGADDNILLAGQPLRYHWFAYGWAGSLTDAIGSGPFVVLTRILPVLLVLGCAWLAAAWARSLTANRWAPGLASLLVVVGAYLGAQQGVVLPFESPSNGFATMLLLAFALAMTRYLRGDIGRGALLVFLVLGFGIVGAKASHAAVLAAALAAVLLGTVVRRAPVRGRAAAMVAMTAIAMAACGIAVLAGIAGSENQIQFGGEAEFASTYQGLDAGLSTIGVALGMLALTLAAAPRWAGLAFLVIDRRTRWEPETLFGIGLVLAAIATLVLLRSGTNAAWFALAATAPLAVLSSVGLAAAWDRQRAEHGPWRHARWLIAACLALAVGVCMLVFINSGFAEVSGAPIRWRGPVLGWLLAAVGAWVALLVVERRPRPSGSAWGIVLVLTMSLASIGARVIGPLLWDAVGSTLTPPMRGVILRLDPTAQLPQAAGAPRSIAGGRVSTGIRAEAPQTPEPGTAYSLGIVEWTPVLNDTARALRDAAGREDVVATDATLRQPFLPVMTDLRMFIAGQPYVDGYTTASGVAAIAERRALLDAFLQDPAPATRDALRAAGVRWLWLQRDAALMADRTRGLGTVLTANDEVVVLDISAVGASSP